MRIFYYGNLGYGSTSLQRLTALQALGHMVYAMDKRIFIPENGFGRNIFHRFQERFGLGPVVRKINKALKQEALRFEPDLVWIDQGALVQNMTIENIRQRTGALFIHFTPDALRSRGFLTPWMRGAIPFYDACITNKPGDVDGYKNLRARRIIVSQSGFDLNIHRPTSLSSDEIKRFVCDVGFVGRAEDDRRNIMAKILEAGHDIKLWGSAWDRGKHASLFKRHFGGWLYGHEYAKAVCGARINMCFLFKDVEDQHTTRTFEIPACGGFMIAERTNEHLSFFKEGKEAEFFSGTSELLDKVHYYLEHPAGRRAIAEAGRRKVIESGWDWRSLLGKALNELCLNDEAT